MAHPKPPRGPSLFGLLKPYKWLIVGLLSLSIASNALNLSLPKRISNGIDAFAHGTFSIQSFMLTFLLTAIGILVFTYLQSLVQTYASEKVALDLRTQLAAKISRQSVSYIQEVTPSKLLTNLTSDIDAVKLFVSQAIVSMVSSVFIIIGASALLLSINWKLALAVLLILPLIGLTFGKLFSKVGLLFKESQQVIDHLNKVINESILGSALIRVLNAQQQESEKFLNANTQAKDIGIKILRLFASAIPVITFLGGMATLVVLGLGGHFVITGSMTIGELAAFNGYLSLLIFPILIIGFMSNAISRASASYARVVEVLNNEEKPETGTRTEELKGDITVEHLTLNYGEKPVLKDVSFTIKAGTKTAIIGPTAAGKTQLLQLMTGLLPPTSGKILFDGHPLEDYNPINFHAQVGFVFQDSILFNLSVRENIAFSEVVKEETLKKAISTAELSDFINELPEKLNTVVSERGTSLSGGQKQRVMLARALALDPKILLLDDFTARIDANTEKRVLENVAVNYPHLTLISITQKIEPIEHYDQIILLMEGEIIATGTHAELMKTCPEYVQIAQSQRSTETYVEPTSTN
jgi:ATP-binding cassette subfamily B protein